MKEKQVNETKNKRKRTISIAKENIEDFSNELLKILNEKYRVVCVSDTPIEDKAIKITQKKPTAFVTLRKNSILFDGDVEKCKSILEKMVGNKVALDFDGVINSYISGWTGIGSIEDEPTIGIIELIKECQNKYEEVAIFSSRCSSATGIGTMDNYLKKYGVNIDTYLENIDDTYILIDDRVIDYTSIENIVEYLETFDSWVNKKK